MPLKSDGTKPWRLLMLSGGVAVCAAIAFVTYVHLIATGNTGLSQPAHSFTSISPPPPSSEGIGGVSTCSVSVSEYGASTSASNNAAAFQAAIDAGEGGTVCIPAGTWKVTSQIIVPAAETLTGAGSNRTTLLQTVTGHNLLQVKGQGTVVEGLTLDTQTHDGGVAFSTGASHVTLRNAQVRGGNQPGHFAIYFAGPRGATVADPHFSTGNILENVVVNDQICDDGVSWSFQTDGTINNVHETGSRLALYVDNGTTVDGYQYTPGPCKAQDYGYWITPPSQNITLNGFFSSGAAGKICPNTSLAHGCSNITVDGERAPRGTLQIGDVTSLRVLDSTVGEVVITTATGATGTWTSSRPLSARCKGTPVKIVGLLC
jgi:hypothetical protein